MTREGVREQLRVLIPETIKHQEEKHFKNRLQASEIVEAIMENFTDDGITVEQLVDTSLATIRKTEYAVEVSA